MYFYDLPRFEQMRYLQDAVSYPTHNYLLLQYSLKPRLSYVQSDPMRTLRAISMNPYAIPFERVQTAHEYKLVSAILKLLSIEPVCSNLNLYTTWGFVLEDNGTPLLICQNLCPTNPTHLVRIDIQALRNTYEYDDYDEYEYDTHDSQPTKNGKDSRSISLKKTSNLRLTSLSAGTLFLVVCGITTFLKSK